MSTKIFGRIGSFFKGTYSYGIRHKIQASLLLLVILGLGYWGYTTYQKSVTTTQYVLAFTHIAPIQKTVTGSGQVASEHQLNLSPKTGGTVAAVNVQVGDTVSAGQIVATIDMQDANKALRDAAANLESARISYQQSLTSTANTTDTSSDSVFTTNASSFSDMSSSLTGMSNIMFGAEVSGSHAVENVYAYSRILNDNATLAAERDRVLASYATANAAYHSAFSVYTNTTRSSDPATIVQMTQKSYLAAQAVAQAAGDLSNYLNDVHQRLLDISSPQPSTLASHVTLAGNYLSTMNSDVTALASAKNNLNSAVQTGGTGSDSLAIESAKLSYQKAQNAYQDAKDNVENYIIRAPFSGTIASIPLQKFDQAGSGTTVAVLITKQQYATLSLNEIDAANVRVGQPATLTFDAITGLTISGTVAEVSQVGTVTQGVVSYAVKIGFDTQDPRILPGMTVSATIVTASNDSALVVPSSAIKTQGAQSYVQVATYIKGTPPNFANASSTRTNRFGTSSPAGQQGQFQRSSTTGAGRTGTARTGPTVDASAVSITRVNVTTGIVGLTTTEITSGLSPGQFVVSQSLNATGNSTAQTPSLLNLFGVRTNPATGGVRTGGGAGAGTSGTRTGTGSAGVGASRTTAGG